jgi:lysophospholipase L1-like esterase
MRRRQFLSSAAVTSFATPAALRANAPASCGADPVTTQLLTDWPNLGHFAQHNAEIKISEEPVKIVFLGDSITQGWPDKRPDFFRSGRVCRGIGGQTTGQMLLRMMADVVALKPKAVHILAGTNDIAGNTGPMTHQQTIDNISAMAVLAKTHGIKVILGAIPPAANFPWRPRLSVTQSIVTLNKMLADVARRNANTFVDYHSALSDEASGMKQGLAYDGVHPDKEGYAVMEKVLLRVLPKNF